MLFCLTAEYTAQAVEAMIGNANTNRRQAVNQLLEAAGGKVVDLFHTVGNGPGALVIIDVPDPTVAPAITSVAVASGSLRNVQLTRLYTIEETNAVREKAQQIRSAYKAPGQQ